MSVRGLNRSEPGADTDQVILRRVGSLGLGSRGNGSRGEAAPQQGELPTINQLVRLVPPDKIDVDPVGLSSRVEDVDTPGRGQPPAFLVVAPDYRGDLVDTGVGGPWLLTWLSERGRWEVPVRRADAPSPESGPRSWWLTPSGPVERNQRREFFRAACSGSVSVELLTEEAPRINGLSVDISEGGLRCVLPEIDGGIDIGTRVLVRFAAEGPAGTYSGVVVRVADPGQAAKKSGWKVEIAVSFDDVDRHGDILRQHVVQLQLRARRLAPPTPDHR